MKILLVSDSEVIWQGLQKIFDGQHIVLPCAESTRAGKLLTNQEIGLVIAGPSDVAGFAESLRLLTEFRSHVPFLFLSSLPVVPFGIRAVREGAAGWLPQSISVRRLFKALDRVSDGLRVLGSELVTFSAEDVVELDTRDPSFRLTNRELEVFHQLGSGKGVKEVASFLKISPKTVESHCNHIKEKLGLLSGLALTQSAAVWAAFSRLPDLLETVRNDSSTQSDLG